MRRRRFLQGLGGVWLAAPALLRAAAAPAELRLDYAYYSPLSLVLRRQGWLEAELAAQGTAVRWVLSQGSNRALEYLAAGSLDLGSSAGLAALLARANGNPVRAVYLFSRPEWTALVVAKDSPIQAVAELRGHPIAATKGTDPYLFLLRALAQHGVRKDEVEIVHLQHPEGRQALEQGAVAAWAGLDPHMAASELGAGSRLLYRNPAFNSGGFLCAAQEFAVQQPALLELVLGAYERARRWALERPDETARILAEESRQPLEVARLQLQRTDLSSSALAPGPLGALREAAPILQAEALVRPGADLVAALAALAAPARSAAPAQPGG